MFCYCSPSAEKGFAVKSDHSPEGLLGGPRTRTKGGWGNNSPSLGRCQWDIPRPQNNEHSLVTRLLMPFLFCIDLPWARPENVLLSQPLFPCERPLVCWHIFSFCFKCSKIVTSHSPGRHCISTPPPPSPGLIQLEPLSKLRLGHPRSEPMCRNHITFPMNHSPSFHRGVSKI